MNKEIYIIRHGQTDYNLQGIVQGSGVDTSLNNTGRRQSRAFYETYRHLPFLKVITSGLRRTHETVAPFIDQGIQWEQFPEINEISWGVQEGQRSTPESHAEYKAVVSAWENENYHAAMPAGESAFEMGQRLHHFVDELRKMEEELVLVCSHGRAMRALMCLLKGVPLSNMGAFQHSNTGLWHVQQQDNRFQFLKENDTSHLPQ